MPEIVPVPERAAIGSQSPIPDLAAWRSSWLEAQADPDRFWLGVARTQVRWRRAPTRGLDGGYHAVAEGPFAWFADGILNVSESCVDRHAEARPEQAAIQWIGDELGEHKTLTYAELRAEVCRTANALAALGVRKGDRVIIYMGMVPEAAVAMLACARLGAVHSVVFGGFSAESLRDRVRDCGAEVIITQDEGRRGGRAVPLKAIADRAVEVEPSVRHLLVLRRAGAPVAWQAGRDRWWHEEIGAASDQHEAVSCDAEEPLFILYTSGSTGRPKGLVHTCGGYLTYASWTHRIVFDLREGDVYACMADVGWITGHSYIVYGPLCNGATTVMFESTPVYPDAGRYWAEVERLKINILYTAPTAIRTLVAAGEDPVKRHDRSSLRVLGTVGEPIDPESWRWFHRVVGEGRCALVDTWWQTETGGILISPLAPATPAKPGSATLPLPGIAPVLIGADGRRVRGPGQGHLCIEQPWPGQARTVWGDHARYVATYFSTHPGLYFTGDGCTRDSDGYHWITGRVDDVLNVAGHRIGTAEIESALTTADEVAEAAVVGYPHPMKGQGVYAFVVLHAGAALEGLIDRLNAAVRAHIGAIARVDRLQVVPGLPKTRSGKVMRRILRKVAEGDASSLGDTSTLADPGVVDAIVAGAGITR